MKTNNIIQELNKWISDKGSGGYTEGVDSYTEYYSGTKPIEGIQQNENEIKEFVEYLNDGQNKQNNGTILEIGLGYYGSTHFLWRLIFKKTITIEYQKYRVFKFTENMNKFHNRFVLNDLNSRFIFGLSHDTSSVEKLEKMLDGEKLDLLFIDGDHTYKSVLCDWLLYKNFVAKGGIIAFHDCVANDDGYGVPKFLKKIKSFDGSIKLKKIVESKNFGIAYYYKQ